MAKKRKKKQKISTIVFIVVLALILVGVIAYLIVNGGDIFQKNNENVAATVNGQKILQTELDSAYDKLPSQYKLFVTKDQLLDQLIDKKLLLSKASVLGITASNDEIDNQISVLQDQFPNETFDQFMASQNLTLNDIKTQLKEQIIISKLLNATAFKDLSVKDDEIGAYYTQNSDQFVAKQDQVRVEYIFADSDAKKVLVQTMLKNSTDFDKLSNNGKNLSLTSGRGFVTKGTESAEIEKAVFGLKVGDYSPSIQTTDGYYFFKRLPDRIFLQEARDSIAATLLRQKQSTALDTYLAQLKTNATIQIGFNSTVVPEISTTPVAPAINDFTETGDNICFDENQKPIIRIYTSNKCSSCSTVIPAVENSISGFDVVERKIDLDAAVKTGYMAADDLAVLKKYDPTGAVPAYIVGCKYVRIGNAYVVVNPDVEEKVFKDVLAKLFQ